MRRLKKSLDVKRLFDLAVGVPAALLVAPLAAIVAVAILVTSGRPILLAQVRVGSNERPIRVLKFRTMRRDTPIVPKSRLDALGNVFTPLGPFLRRWSIDELPQVLNVLHGEMSLVGPRPALPAQHDLLALRRRHTVLELKPGITGLAQVEGRESLTLATKVRFEALYKRRQSLGLDVLILAKTVRVLFSSRGTF